MKILNERHQFIENHPQFYPFLKEIFGNDVENGTVIEISVKRPNTEEKRVQMEVQESEQGVFRSIQEMLK